MHRIRLREPWNTSTPGGEGPVVYSRAWNLPTGLTSASQVWLVIVPIQAKPQATLNGTPCGAGETQTGDAGETLYFWNVTACLSPHNRLEISLDGPSSPVTGERAFPGEVWLEIYDEAPTV